jgi:hypothetical protein
MSIQEIKFQVRRIDILAFSLKTTAQQISQNTAFRFDTKIEHKANLNEKTIVVLSSFNILCEKTKTIMADAEIACVYYVENFNQYVDQSGKLNFPLQHITMFNSISISTCRGVLSTLFRGTPLHSVILPVINPHELTRKDHNK